MPNLLLPADDALPDVSGCCAIAPARRLPWTGGEFGRERLLCESTKPGPGENGPRQACAHAASLCKRNQIARFIRYATSAHGRGTGHRTLLLAHPRPELVPGIGQTPLVWSVNPLPTNTSLGVMDKVALWQLDCNSLVS